MKTRHRSHPVSPSKASSPRTSSMGKRAPTGTRMGVKGSDPNLYNHNGDLIDIEAIQAKVVEKTKENIVKKASGTPVQAVPTSPVDPSDMMFKTATSALQDFKKDYGKMPWFRGAGIATGNRLRLMVDGKYKGETPETYQGIQIELVMVDKLRPRKGQ